MDDYWGPCESREEWLLMFERGLTPERIADLCRVDVRKVRRVTARADERDRGYFDRRLKLHDQPALPRQRPRLAWRQLYDNLRWFVETTGQLPRQDGSTWERQCHGFMYAQRRAHHAGRLTAEQVELMDHIDGWFVPPRAPDHWDQRFADYRRFVEEHARRPSGEAPKGGEERSLAIWIWSQRKRLKSGTMPEARAAVLDSVLPGWQGQTAASRS